MTASLGYAIECSRITGDITKRVTLSKRRQYIVCGNLVRPLNAQMLLTQIWPELEHELITRIIFGEEYQSLGSSLCSFIHSPVTSSLLGPNILLNTLFSNTLSQLSSLNLSGHVSQPHQKLQTNLHFYIF